MATANKIHEIFDLLKKGYQEHTALILQIKDSDNIYIQYSFMPEEEMIWWEAVSNEYLNEEEKLTASKEKILESMGFSLKDNPNFFKTVKVKGDYEFQEIAQKSIEIFEKVYDKGPNPIFQFEFID